jgi:hypothetical protein
MIQPFGCNRWAKLSAIPMIAFGLAACDESVMDTQLRSPVPQMAVVLPTMAQQLAYACANGPAGTYGFTASEVDNFNIGTLNQGGAFNLAQDQCVLVATTNSPGRFGENAQITITGTSMPTDVVLDSITKLTGIFASSGSPTPTTTTTTQHAGPGTTFDLGLEIGVILVFNYTLRPPPPPPGGEGCTPGYWKQSQHFGNWTAPYTPGTLFSAVFADAFPGKTLLEVVGMGGGGLNALGRHTVAALLNAASADVDGDFTTAEVITAFNAAFVSGDYETQKNIFAASNEQGCGLARAE